MPSVVDRSDTAVPRFLVEPVQNMSLSEKEGRPVFEDKEIVEIRIPGDKHNIPRLYVHEGKNFDMVMARWPKQYEAFKRNEVVATIGTPLEMWPNPALTRSRIAEFKSLFITNVEELSGVPDNVLPKLGMGGRELREQARTYLERAADGAAESKMAAELATLRAMVEQLQKGNAPIEEPKEKTLEDCTDEELKAFIKRETGEGVRGTPTRATLMSKAAEIANAKAEAA